jgi:hypothetical protein
MARRHTPKPDALDPDGLARLGHFRNQIDHHDLANQLRQLTAPRVRSQDLAGMTSVDEAIASTFRSHGWPTRLSRFPSQWSWVRDGDAGRRSGVPGWT